MAKGLHNLLLFMLFFFLVIAQPAQITSQNTNKVDESTITSASYMSDADAAHITAPTTLPVNNAYETDVVIPPVRKSLYRYTPTSYPFNFVPNETESIGFIDVRKYQSNYLPCYL